MSEDNVTRFPGRPVAPDGPLYGVEFVGPWEPEWRVTVDGFTVPFLTAAVQESGEVWLSLDRRFGIQGTREEVSKWVPLLANALAIGAGWSCHGEHSQRPNPFKVGMVGLGDIPS